MYNIYEIYANYIDIIILIGLGLLRKFQQYRRLPQVFDHWIHLKNVILGDFIITNPTTIMHDYSDKNLGRFFSFWISQIWSTVFRQSWLPDFLWVLYISIMFLVTSNNCLYWSSSTWVKKAQINSCRGVRSLGMCGSLNF